ncbi:hypothetical protein ACFSX9_10730 [Flavobacterium ardleyense]|uniref:Uncharacterized protein n=1 Tax=Flavobacterium ardleyense TaxID=2038737 RepID=A0ABW5ZAF8_9FLAO
MLNDILIEIKKYPTILNIEDEIFFMTRIEKISLDEIINNEKIIFEILSILESSHEQTIFQVDDENIIKYRKFSTWIRQLKKIFLNKDNYIEVLAENMEATFR